MHWDAVALAFAARTPSYLSQPARHLIRHEPSFPDELANERHALARQIFAIEDTVFAKRAKPRRDAFGVCIVPLWIGILGTSIATIRNELSRHLFDHEDRRTVDRTEPRLRWV
jgi:hypothetical protein